MMVCTSCNGTGRGIFGGNCATCSGKGTIDSGPELLGVIVGAAVVVALVLYALIHSL